MGSINHSLWSSIQTRIFLFPLRDLSCNFRNSVVHLYRTSQWNVDIANSTENTPKQKPEEPSRNFIKITIITKSTETQKKKKKLPHTQINYNKSYLIHSKHEYFPLLNYIIKVWIKSKYNVSSRWGLQYPACRCFRSPKGGVSWVWH